MFDVIIPEAELEISIPRSPKDSVQFKIPSLSKSKSILLFVPSLSVSEGQKLTGILSEKIGILLGHPEILPLT